MRVERCLHDAFYTTCNIVPDLRRRVEEFMEKRRSVCEREKWGS